MQGVDRGVQCPQATFELGDEVLLVAAAPGLCDHLVGGQRLVVGDVEEVAVELVEEHVLAAGH